jgi:hypothetical protein
MNHWKALGAEFRETVPFQGSPSHVVQKVGWVNLTAEGVRDLLQKAEDIGFGFHHAEPDRITVGNLEARYRGDVVVDQQPEDPASIFLFHNGNEIACWNRDLQRVFVRLPIFLAPFDADLEQALVQEFGQQLEGQLRDGLPDGFELEILDRENESDGPWWTAHLSCGCTNVAQLEEALRITADHATTLRPVFPKSRHDGCLDDFVRVIPACTDTASLQAVH